MKNISAIKRAIYRYAGVMLWLIHWTDTHGILGIRVSSLIRLAVLVLPFFAWFARWERFIFFLAILLFIWVYASYWRVRRTGYYRFVSDNEELMAASAPKRIAKNRAIDITASGTFSVKDWEKNVVLQPASYWQVPLGDHAIMVEHEPSRYLYQFFNAATMQELNSGWLLYGTRPHRALEVKFLSIWGPEFSEDTVSLLRNANKSKPSKMRTVYLSFENDELENIVWQNILFDARRVRTG